MGRSSLLRLVLVIVLSIPGLLGAADSGFIGLTQDITTLQGQSISSDTLTFDQLILGQEINVGIYADSIQGQLWGYGFDLVYDPTVFQVTSGPTQEFFFEKGIPLVSDSTVFVDTDKGDGRIQLAAFVKEESDSLGSSVGSIEGLMVTFKFKTLAAAATEIKLENIYLFFLDPVFNRDTDPVQGVPVNLLSVTLAQGQQNLKQFTVYPNPYRPNDGNNNTGKAYQPGDPEAGIIFAGLATSSRIAIYSLTGERVRELVVTGSGVFNWDVKNDKGNDVASGLYLYVVTSPAGEKRTGKLMVIR